MALNSDDWAVQPSTTPNVVVANPAVRRAVGWVLGITGLILPIAGIIDGKVDAVDWSTPLGIASEVTLFLAGAFGTFVTVPNVPKS